MTDPLELQNYANSLGSGHLKAWKANAIYRTLSEIDGIKKDRERLNAYVRNCLTMEGFSDDHCSQIANYILAIK